jgi:hypothetical protein
MIIKRGARLFTGLKMEGGCMAKKKKKKKNKKKDKKKKKKRK